MIQLEQLYNCARDHLEKDKQDWAAFSKTFKVIFDSEFALYSVENDGQGWVDSSLTVLSTSKPDVIKAFIDGGFHRQTEIKETEMASLEPARRTDVLSDEDYLKLPIVHDFHIKHGLFYLMIVPAIVHERNSLSLMVWRDQNEADFDDKEKMRLGLFMRYLMKIIDTEELVHAEQSDELRMFGETYGLTKTEAEILSYLLEGYSLRQIANDTERSYGTIRWHIRNLLEKCHVSDQKNLLRQFYTLIKK